MIFKELTLDHVKPRSKGGQDLTTNVVCACRKCNADKGSSHLARMDAKGIWIPATSRTNYSSTH